MTCRKHIPPRLIDLTANFAKFLQYCANSIMCNCFFVLRLFHWRKWRLSFVIAFLKTLLVDMVVSGSTSILKIYVVILRSRISYLAKIPANFQFIEESLVYLLVLLLNIVPIIKNSEIVDGVFSLLDRIKPFSSNFSILKPWPFFRVLSLFYAV